MPELPEVEVVKKSLEKSIINLTKKSVKINDLNLRYKVKKHDFKKIIDLKILKIERKSKYLLFFFGKKFVMIVHLGMTGKFFINKNDKNQKTSFYYNNEDKNNKHDRVIFTLNKNLKLIYNDIRKFGFIKILLTKDISKNEHLVNLGPEPMSHFFNYKYVKNYIVGKKKTTKDMLMDQRFISGLGNIYANEILFFTKIKPTKKVSILSNEEINQIIKVTKKVLKKAIKLGGSSIKDFSNTTGKKGNFQDHFKVYGKKGFKCSNFNCSGIIKKIMISNRASFFCMICQK